MRVVITGSNSYIGNSLQSYIGSIDDNVKVDQLDVVGDTWREVDFSKYETVVHVAAIVHRKDTTNWDVYKQVNIDLTVEIAEKAKSQGVKHFIFLSSMAVYGVEKSLLKDSSVISYQTEMNPVSMYGKSKYIAEQKLSEIKDENFIISIIRPPNVYGPGCKGGYISTYVNIVSKLPVIPEAFTSVKQSVLYIDNLSRFIYLIIVEKKAGVYTPQDDESITAVKLMEYISEALGRKKKTSRILGLFANFLSFLPIVKKGFGGVSYDREISHQDDLNYLVVPCKEGIKRTVLYGAKYNHSNI